MTILSRLKLVIALFFLMFAISTRSYSACLEGTSQTMDVKDGIAIDNSSGLVWQRCVVGTRWNSRKKRCDGEVKGLTQREARAAASRAGSAWRVPSARELESLRFNRCQGPKIDIRIFPNISSTDLGEGMNVWSSTPAISADTFYFLNFSDGSFDFHSEGFNLAVLLVRKK